MNIIEQTYNGKLLVKTIKYSFVYRKGTLIVYSVDSNNIIMKHPLYHDLKKKMSKCRIIERMLRLESRCAVALNESTVLISTAGFIWYVNVENREAKIEHTYRIGMNGPLNFCEYEVNGEKRILYGEYLQNTKNSTVFIWCRMNGKWKQVQSFSKNTITHIHYITYDLYRDEFLIATGDTDKESGIWSMGTDFRVISPILRGMQMYRSCFVFPTKEGFLYSTDTPLEKNSIYMYNYKEKNEPIKIYDMAGPCIYTWHNKTKFAMATSVEPNSNIKGWRYYITNQLGVGIKDRYSHVIFYDGIKIREILKLKKDILPMCLFQFGNCQFPKIYQKECPFIFITPIAVKKYDGKTIKIHLE